MPHRARRDRAGEPLDPDAPDEHDCDNGWLDRHSDPARPCLLCRPHLAPAERRRRATGRTRR